MSVPNVNPQTDVTNTVAQELGNLTLRVITLQTNLAQVTAAFNELKEKYDELKAKYEPEKKVEKK